MPAKLTHFAINADNVDRARTFYETALELRFDAWGPPKFYRTQDAGEGITGALQQRREIVSGKPITGFENTFAVSEIGATLDAVVKAGGRAVSEPFAIPGVGTLAFCEDTEGNVFGVMQYDSR